MRIYRIVPVLLLVFATVLAGCASTPDRASALREAQYAWSAAIRWGDFEGAWNLVDPAYRAAHPMTRVEPSFTSPRSGRHPPREPGR